MRQFDLLGEHPLLNIARSVVVVVVQPGLADGDDAGRREEVDDRVDALDGVMGVQADRRSDLGMGGGCGDRRL